MIIIIQESGSYMGQNVHIYESESGIFNGPESCTSMDQKVALILA